MPTLVQQYFSNSAAKYPDKIAICCEENSITFKDLDTVSNQFSRDLKSNGVKRQEFIPFFLKKSINSIKAILSILKADCAYVPIDIHTPAARLRAILNTTNASVIIVDDFSQPLLESLLQERNKPLLINIDQLKSPDNSPIKYQNISIDIAYVLFTSGSTGTPKGVMIPHKAIIDYIDWCVDAYNLSNKDIIANHAPLYFDNSTFDIYTAFKTGATLHLVHEELNSVLPSLVKWIDQRSITVFFCVPSVLTLLLKSRRLKEDSLKQLRHFICAGEALPAQPISTMMDKYPHIQFTNMYGPTEITVDCSYHILTQKPSPQQAAIPIGKARNNMELFVRDEDGQLHQKIGSKGELLVRGTSVSYGYLGDTEKTERVFIQNPFNKNFHDPLYCTGDIVEIEEDGNYMFIGRIDDQIKHLGYRIELGEIDMALSTIESVSERVVVFQKESADGQIAELGALVNLSGGDIDQLVRELREKLPAYMVPTKIKEYKDEFPRTPNGKYDRKQISKIIFDH